VGGWWVGYWLLCPKAIVQGNFNSTPSSQSTTPPPAQAVNSDGWSALHLAARAGATDKVKLLLASGADPALKTKHGLTSLALVSRWWLIYKVGCSLMHVYVTNH